MDCTCFTMRVINVSNFNFMMDSLNACLILIGLVIDTRFIFQLGFVVSIWYIIQLRNACVFPEDDSFIDNCLHSE